MAQGHISLSQIQSAINEGPLKFQEDMEPFPMDVIDLNGKKILIRPSTADNGKDKEVIIVNAREAEMEKTKSLAGKWWPRRPLMEGRH
jgi:hypothetical protein